MKSLFLVLVCMALLAACSFPSKATPTPTQTSLPIPTLTQPVLPTFSEAPSPTPTIISYCIVPALLNVRSGPGIQYTIVVILGQGTCGTVSARNEDLSWVYFSSSKYSGWVYTKYLSGKGDINSLPVYTALTLTPQAATQSLVASQTPTP